MKKYDNMFCKPPQLGDGPNARYSVMVKFFIEEDAFLVLSGVSVGLVLGQYNFEDCTWSVLPSGTSAPVEDRYVIYWHHVKDYEKLCENCFSEYHKNILRNKKWNTNSPSKNCQSQK